MKAKKEKDLVKDLFELQRIFDNDVFVVLDVSKDSINILKVEQQFDIELDDFDEIINNSKKIIKKGFIKNIKLPDYIG
jgi:hypothetical protein